MKMLKNALCLLVISASFACSSGGSAVDIGASRTGEKLADYADTWVGYAEAYTFDDGSDKVQITIDAQGHGTVVWGDSPPIAPATDPDVGYPAGGMPPQNTQTFPGFPYPIKSATVESGRLQLAVNPGSFFDGWCGLSTTSCDDFSTATGGNGAPCAAVYNGVEQPIDCNKLFTCVKASCMCTAGVCTGYDPGPGSGGLSNYILIDGALADGGDSLLGTLAIGALRITLHLQRQ